MISRSRIAIIGTAVLAGCQKPVDYTERLSSLEERIQKLEQDKSLSDIIASSEGQAFLKTSETTYVMTKADFGNVAISVENVEEYADGTRVTLKFGNTTSANIIGLKAKLEWGPLDEKGVVVGEPRSKDESFVESLPAASWRQYQIILPGLPPKKVGFIRFSNIESSQLSLVNRL